MIIIIILKQNTQAFKLWITENIKSDFLFFFFSMLICIG